MDSSEDVKKDVTLIEWSNVLKDIQEESEPSISFCTFPIVDNIRMCAKKNTIYFARPDISIEKIQ